GWTTWQTVTGAANLPSGQHVLKLVMDTNGPTGGIGNFNYLRFTQGTPSPTPTPPPSTPYNGTPAPLPGTLQVEEFDNGGEGVAYHDTDTNNNGGQFRTEGV